MKPVNAGIENVEEAFLAGGCFWCLEAQFQYLEGVLKIEPGFTGGHLPHPTYQDVCTGATGHAETCRIVYNPNIITYRELLFAFFKAHDPTQLNRQGNDIGTQYRSAVFYTNDRQKETVEKIIEFFEESKVYEQPIVTQIAPVATFYPAEDYHKNYYNLHGENPYCQLVVQPKVKHFLEYLEERHKEGKQEK